MTKPTPAQEKVLLRLAKHYAIKNHTDAWYVKKNQLWSELAKPWIAESQGQLDNYTTKCLLALSKNTREYGRLRSTYLVHIKRLQDQVRVLGEALADERTRRQKAYKWYQDKLSSRWGSFVDWIIGTNFITKICR